MTSSQLREILKSNILTLAAADKAKQALWEDYIQAGAHILLAPACVRMDDEEADILEGLHDVAAERAFVAGQLAAPADKLTEAGGTLAYEAYYKSVLQRACWLADMDVSMVFMTGFRDVATAKCALYAIREAALDMPVCAGICVSEESGGLKAALSMLIALQSLGICAFGISGMDIEDALELISELQAFTTVPLFLLADPGRFLTPEIYSDYIPSLVNHKCAMLGLMQGSPTLTTAAAKTTWQFSPLQPDFPLLNAVCSQNEALFLDFGGKIVSQNKQLIEIKTEKEEELKQALELFNKPGTAPVCFDIRDIEILEYAITHYAGRPAVRSDEYGEITAKELGALVLSKELSANKS